MGLSMTGRQGEWWQGNGVGDVQRDRTWFETGSFGAWDGEGFGEPVTTVTGVAPAGLAIVDGTPPPEGTSVGPFTGVGATGLPGVDETGVGAEEPPLREPTPVGFTTPESPLVLVNEPFVPLAAGTIFGELELVLRAVCVGSKTLPRSIIFVSPSGTSKPSSPR